MLDLRATLAEPVPAFIPQDWYWQRASGALFSSARIAEVSATDEAYVEWVERGFVPTPYPKDAEGSESVAELEAVLSPYGLHASLEAHARDLSWRIRVGGTEIGGVRVATDDGGLALLNGLKGLAEDDPTATFPFDDGSPAGVSLSAEQAIALAKAAGAWVQATFKRRLDVLKAIRAGTLATKEAVEAALAAPIAA